MTKDQEIENLKSRLVAAFTAGEELGHRNAKSIYRFTKPEEEVSQAAAKYAKSILHHHNKAQQGAHMNEERNELNSPSGSDEPQDCPNCPNQGWYAVQYTHADGTLDQRQQQCEWCYTIPNSKFNQNH